MLFFSHIIVSLDIKYLVLYILEYQDFFMSRGNNNIPAIKSFDIKDKEIVWQ